MQEQQHELEDVVVEPSQPAPKKKPKRDRKDYMQLYYQKHKSPDPLPDAPSRGTLGGWCGRASRRRAGGWSPRCRVS